MFYCFRATACTDRSRRKKLARSFLASTILQEAARTLISLACEKDGGDNISVQLIRIKGVERVGMYRGRPYKLR